MIDLYKTMRPLTRLNEELLFFKSLAVEQGIFNKTNRK